MTFLVPLILVAIILATYLASLNLALMGIRRSTLQNKLTDLGRPAAGDWLYEHITSALLATALLRTLARMTIYILTLAMWIGLRTEAHVTWSDLIISGLIAAAVIWFTTIVLGTAIARHFGVRVIAANLGVIRTISLACTPFTKAGLLVDRLFLRLIGSKQRGQAEAELLESIEDVQREGALDIQSAEILENVVEFTNTEVSQVMTPRTEIEGIEYTDELSTIREFIRHAGHSRIPVYKGNIDNIVGILYLKDLIRYLGEDAADFQLSQHLRQPIVVPETKPVRELLSVFQHSEVHLAIVIDEYGATAGLVTIENVLEEIVGDIRDEHEPEEDNQPDLLEIDDTRAEVDGRYRIHELNTQLHLDLPENGDYDTVAGFMLWHFGRVPSPGESFETPSARFTTLQSTATSVQRVGVELLQDDAASVEPQPQAAK